MSIKVAAQPAITVIGLAIRTRPMSPDIPRVWPRFVPRIAEIEAQTDPGVTYGVMWHGQGSMDDLHYMAAVAVASPARVPKSMESLILPAGEYAVFSYPLSDLGKGFGEIFDRLLPQSGFEQAPGPYFEHYDRAFDPGIPAARVGIHIPVRRVNR
jgi:AraC family transcriptional regulator